MTASKQTRIFLIVLLTLLAAALLASCGGKDPLLGKWQNEEGAVMEFYEDGTFTMADQFGLSYTGSYTQPDDGVLRLQLSGLLAIGGDIVADYSISGNELTLSYMGQTDVMTRVRD